MRELTRTTQRLLESSTGKFDLAALTKEMFRRVGKREALNFDCADFKSSQISIENIENKSKGVIANDMIKKGTLLCASKALSAVYKYTLDGHSRGHGHVCQFDSPNAVRSLFDATSLFVVSWRWI